MSTLWQLSEILTLPWEAGGERHWRSGDFDAGVGSPMEVCAVKQWREKIGPRAINQYRPMQAIGGTLR